VSYIRHRALAGEYSSPCIFMHHHNMKTLPTRRGSPQKPSSRPSVWDLCTIANPIFGEFYFHAVGE
jgi:hypothetical protein